MANQPVLLIRLTGEGNCQILNESISWTPKDKIETTLTMIAGDTAKVIDLTSVTTIRTMMFIGSGNFTVTISVGSPANIIAFESQDIFMISPTETFAATINSISISTTSTTEISIECRVYGE